MKKINRREALKVGAIGAAGLATGAMFIPNKIWAKTTKKVILKTAAKEVKPKIALTLVEQAKIAMNEDILQASTMELFAKSSDILQYLPFENISGNAVCFNRAHGKTIERVTECLTIVGGDLDIDVEFAKRKGKDFTEFRAETEQRKIKSLGQSLSKTIIKGDEEKNPREFDGLQVRCKDNQLISNSQYGNVLFLNKLDELITSVDKPTHLLMNRYMRRRIVQYYSQAYQLYMKQIKNIITSERGKTTWFDRMSKARKHFEESKNIRIRYELDAFRRRVTHYNGLPILISGKDNDHEEILPFTEKDPSGTPQCTSIYCLSFAKNGVVGLQNHEMKVRDLGEMTTKPVYRTRIEWYTTIAILRTRALARLQYIKDGPIEV